MLKDDKLMLESILDLKDREVDEVMIHRKDIFSLNINLPEKELIETLKKTNFSRLPVWEKPRKYCWCNFSKRFIKNYY